MSYDLVADFRNQAKWCAELESPFMAALMGRTVQALEAGEEPAAILARKTWQSSDALPLRFGGALHWLALSGQEPDLAREYPAQKPDWDIEAVWRAAAAAMKRDPDWFASFISHAPQTNETRRSFALMPAFHAAAENGPLHMWELGASAGLNMHWEKFAYSTPDWSWGAGPLKLTTDWRGPRPLLRDKLVVASRGGCDSNPLDIRDPEQLLRLKSYLWADQRERLERFDGAVALALADHTPVARMDAAEWLEGQVAQGLREGVTILYHSIAWQYFPEDGKARAQAAIDRAAAQANETRRFAWVRFEITPSASGKWSFVVDIQTWPGGERRLLADADPHLRWIAWKS
jgi:hypothetical protein